VFSSSNTCKTGTKRRGFTSVGVAGGEGVWERSRVSAVGCGRLIRRHRGDCRLMLATSRSGHRKEPTPSHKAEERMFVTSDKNTGCVWLKRDQDSEALPSTEDINDRCPNHNTIQLLHTTLYALQHHITSPSPRKSRPTTGGRTERKAASWMSAPSSPPNEAGTSSDGWQTAVIASKCKSPVPKFGSGREGYSGTYGVQCDGRNSGAGKRERERERERERG
jgi:hypothetical protein